MGLLYEIIELIASLMDSFSVVIFLWLLCNKKVYIPSKIWWVITICTGIFVGLIPHFIDNMVIQLICIVVLPFTYAMLMLEQNTGKKISFVILWNVWLMISNFFMVYGMSAFFGIPQSAVSESGSTIRVLMLAIHKILFIFILYFIVAYNKKYKFDYKQWLITVTQFISVLFVGALFIDLYSKNVFDEKSGFEVVIIAVILSIMCIVVCICQHILNIQNMYKVENDRLKNCLEEEEKNIKRIEEMYETSSIIRHDMKHYAVVMNTMLEQGRYSDLKGMLDDIAGGQLLGATVIYTSEKTLNAVLNSKLSICRQYKIDYHVTITCTLPEKIVVDLSVILSNLLDNAIEAEKMEADGYVKININMRGNMLLINVVNKVTNAVLVKNPKLKTTKKDKNSHGFGLKSVNKRVSELDGFYTCKEEDGEFKTVIQIPITE